MLGIAPGRVEDWCHCSVGSAQLVSPRFDRGTLPPGTAADQVWPALQALLGERLQVSIRREKKELPIYALTVAKNGPKLHRAGESGARPLAPRSDESPSGTLRLDNASLVKFCDELSRKTDRPVVDATGIPGTFDFDLGYWRAGDMSGRSVFGAVERQLGLKLEPRKQLACGKWHLGAVVNPRMVQRR